MFFRDSMKNLIRSRGKTALFFALLLILTLMVGLNLCVWLSVNRYLAACDETFTTIGLFEYMGADYPDESIYDPAAVEAIRNFDTAMVAEHESVLLWDESACALGYTEGFLQASYQNLYDKDRAVLVISAPYKMGDGLYFSYIVETVYSHEDFTGAMVYVDSAGLTEFEFGHYYLVCGSFFQGKNSYHHFGLAPLQTSAAQEHGADAIVCLDITDPDGEHGYTLPTDSPLMDIAQTLRVLNNSLTVFSVADLSAQYLFQQNELVLTYGRMFSGQEYAQGAKVCVVSETLAQQLSLQVGDTLPISVSHTGDALPSAAFWAGAGFDSTQTYTVVGVMQTKQEQNGYVYVPKGADAVFAGNRTGYTIGTAVLRNEDAAAFYREIAPQLPDRVRLTIYDQGYGAVAEPFHNILRATNIISIVCALAGACVLVLFGYLFVHRQRDVSVTMVRLGVQRRRVCSYFLCGAGVLSALAAACGGYLGYRLSGRVIAFVAELATTAEPPDTRYSALSIEKSLAFSMEATKGPFVIAAVAVAILALVTCLLFALGTFRRSSVRGVKENREKIRRVARRSGVRYPLLSIRRSGARSVIPPVTMLLAVVFLCRLIASDAAYQAQLDSIYADTEISGAVTDVHGRTTGSLTVRGDSVRTLLASGYIGEMVLTGSMPYMFEGIIESDGVPQEYEPIVYPATGFAQETFLNRALAGPSLICTNSLEKAPEFYYSSFVETAWLDGYDVSVLAADVDENEPTPCIVPTTLMESEGIRLGDIVQLWQFKGSDHQVRQFVVVGSFVKASVKENIYVPIAYYADTSLLSGELDEEQKQALERVSFAGADFTISEAASLDAFKDYLVSNRFSAPGGLSGNRVFIRLQDREFLNMVQTLSNQIDYVGVLYPCLSILVCAAGFVGAFALMVSRKREFAIMRALGARPFRVFAGFFGEQLALCLPGAAIGLALTVLTGDFPQGGVKRVGIFAACWLVGSALSLLRMSGTAVCDILHEEE